MAATTEMNVSLFLHLLFSFAFVALSAAIGILRCCMTRHRKVEAVALLAGLMRPLVPSMVVSLLLSIAFGVWAGYADHHNMAADWLAASYALVIILAAGGIVSGRHDRLTRQAAQGELLAAQGLLVDGASTRPGSADAAGLEAGLVGATSAGLSAGSSGKAAGAGGGDEGSGVLVSQALAARIRSPAQLASYAVMQAVSIVIIALMVWRPGASKV